MNITHLDGSIRMKMMMLWSSAGRGCPVSPRSPRYFCGLLMTMLVSIHWSRAEASSSSSESTCPPPLRAEDQRLLARLQQRTPPPHIVPTQWLPPAITLLPVVGDADPSNPPLLEEDSTTTTTAVSTWKDVWACCQVDPTKCWATTDEASETPGSSSSFMEKIPLQPVLLGRMPQFDTPQALTVLHTAVTAWKGGRGVWPQMSLAQRGRAIQHFFDLLIQEQRAAMIQVLMWEIGKNEPDATAEFDRTVAFAQAVLQQIINDAEFQGSWQALGTTQAFVRRAGLGVILCLAPYNYPLNESYAMMIPALLMGNVVILKIPTVGGLVHLLTMEALARALPPGTVNFIAGSGRATMPPLMATGLIDGLGFIGGSQAADELIQAHPHPHRLKVFLQLEANNMGIFLPDLFVEDGSANPALAALETALDEAIIGTLSFNGQRCTALKLLMVPAQHVDTFLPKLVARVQYLPVGLPWQRHGDNEGPEEAGPWSAITPLPNQQRIEYMQTLLQDALQKGARIQNQGGGTLLGGDESTLMLPAVLYPVTPDMRVYHEEQFGPIIPVAAYDDLESIVEFAEKGPYGQQVSIFGQHPDQVAYLLDHFSSIFGKINLNSQCGRSPDTLPFAGRRSSAMGVMSVRDALREFSVPTVVAYKQPQKGLHNEELVQQVQSKSVFLQPI